MKKIIIIALSLLTFHFSLLAQSRDNIANKDICANSQGWQVSVRGASLTSAYQILADTSQHDQFVLKFSQVLVSDPKQIQWNLAMSYGVLASDPDVNCSSDIFSIQFRVNQIFATQAYAYFGAPPPGRETALSIRRYLNQHTGIGTNH